MKRLLAASAAFSLAVSPIMANPVQTNTGNGASQAQVYGSGSTASSAQLQGQSQHQTAAATGGAGGTGRASSHVTVNNTAGIAGTGSAAGNWPVAPAIPGTIVNGGCNTGGASLVGQLPGIGIGGTLGGKQDIVCQSNEIGRPDVAFVYLCLKDKDYSRASRFTSKPCPGEEVKHEAHEFQDDGPKDYCLTASAGERRQHLECKGVRYE